MAQITCDKCGHSQDFRPRTSRLTNGVERVYIKCEKCGEQYTAFYTNKSIREIQARQRRITRMIAGRSGAEYQKQWDEFEDNKQKLTIQMFELRRRQEAGVPPG